jgi:predicted ester cyclase
MSVRGVLLGIVLVAGLGAVHVAGLRAAVSSTPVASPASCPATTPEENVALVERYVEEVYNQHDPQKAAALLADDFNRSNPSRPHVSAPGLDDDIARVERSLREFPDLHGTIEDVIAADDKVVVRMTFAGTHQGAFEDTNSAATSRQAAWSSILIWRVECGKLAENWVVSDRLGELRQLGIVTDDELADIGTPTVATPAP